MKKESKDPTAIGRRKFLPILGTGLLLPLLPAPVRAAETKEEEDYVTLLKPDGTTVRVKASSLKKSKVVRKKISNSELREWLDKGKEQR